MSPRLSIGLALVLTLTTVEVRAAPEPAPERSIPSALEAITSGEDDGRAAVSLVERGRPGLWALVDAVKTRTGRERGRLFEAIGRFATPEAEWALVVELRRAPPETKVGVLRGMARTKSPKLFPVLVDALDAKDAVVHDGAIGALALLGDRGRDVIARLLASPDPHRRANGVRVVARAGQRRTIDPLLPVALADAAPEVQMEAVRLTVQVNDASQTKALVRLAKSADAPVAVAAVQAIARLRSVAGAWELAEVVAAEASLEPAWREAAAVLRTFGASGLSPFLDAAERAKGGRRAALVELLADGAKPNELELLTGTLADPSAVRAELARQIFDRAGERGVDAVLAAIDGASAPVRRAIIAYVRARPQSGFGAKLVERTNDPSERERLEALELLGEVGDQTALANVVELFQDPSPAIRAAVAHAVAEVPGCGVHDHLLALVKDPAPMARAGALRALARAMQGRAEADAAALAALTDAEADVRIAAIELLAKPTAPSVVRALRLRAMNATAPERAAVAHTLAGSKLVEAIELLVDLSTDHDREVRAAALKALGGGSPSGETNAIPAS